MRERKELTAQQWRERAKALRELAPQSIDPRERDELLAAAKLMEDLAAELTK